MEISFSNIKQQIKNNPSLWYALLVSAFLWLMVWATYNTDITWFMYWGFSHGFVDSLNGIRSLFPLIALALAIIILFYKKAFNIKLLKGPLGLLALYCVVGMGASLLSANPWNAFYWGSLYFSAIMVLFAILTEPHALQKISLILRINFVIVMLITIGLMAIFLLSPGVLSFSAVHQFLSGSRPFEAIGSASFKVDIFGTPGTRPTGLGRYAGLAALLIFANFWQPKKKVRITFYILFAIFFPILIFTRARTSIIAFFIVIGLMLLMKVTSKINYGLILFALFLLLAPTNFYQFSQEYLTGENLLQNNNQVLVENINPRINSGTTNSNITSNVKNTVSGGNNQWAFQNQTSGNTISNNQLSSGSSVNENTIFNNQLSSNTSLTAGTMTLSGRTTGIWPESWKLFLRSPFIGLGFQADRIFLDGQHAHNSLLQALVQSGSIGTFFFVLAFILSWIWLIYLFKKFPGNIILLECIGVLTYFTLRGTTESSAFFGADYLFLVPVMAYLQCLYYTKQKEVNTMQSIKVLGNNVNILSIPETITIIEDWIKNQREKVHWIVATGMHGIVQSHRDPEFKCMISNCDLFVPDGISLVWLARLRGFNIKKRVSGPDLMKEFLLVANQKGYRNYFYGDTDETLQELNKKLLTNLPNLKIVGSYSPPFRKLTQEEDDHIIQKINDAKPDVLWVGLGLPKQERWIFEHKEKLQVPVIIGVGAAFKFLSGGVKRAPKWVGNLGFEWLWRFFQEPKKMWKRVFLDMPLFMWLMLKDSINW